MLPGVPGVLSFLRMDMDCFRMELRNIKGKKKKTAIIFLHLFFIKANNESSCLIDVLYLGDKISIIFTCFFCMCRCVQYV